MPTALHSYKLLAASSSRLFNLTTIAATMPPKRKASSKTTAAQPVAKKQASLDTFVTGAKPKARAPGAAAPPADPTTFDPDQLITSEAWKTALKKELASDYFASIRSFLEAEFKKGVQVFPPREQVFAALNLTPLADVKLVIIGQDPYHDDGQAHGLCFSVERGVPPPPSLKNIYKELATDVPGFKAPGHGNLTSWAEQGALLLNATLTVRAHAANSHASIGWQSFTDAVIRLVSSECSGVVFILWGGFAQKKDKLIDASKHTVIKAAHPSPLSVTKFLGCKCFSKTNDALKAYGKHPIDWTL